MERSLNPSILKDSFSRHETFALRYSWLTKGFQAFTKNPEIFSSDEATIDLGVGKNRVNAIKYWLRATSILNDTAVINSGLPHIVPLFSKHRRYKLHIFYCHFTSGAQTCSVQKP
jgi:hypothetical protein